MTRIIFITLLVTLFSCSSDNPIPEDVLPQDKMKAVLWDVLRADELVNEYATTYTPNKPAVKNADYYQKIFQLHQITRQQFQKSLQFYQQQPRLFQPIIDSLKVLADKRSLTLAAPAVK